MNTLSFRTSEENGLSFELLVDGEPLGQLVGARDRQIPYWIIGAELPTFPPRSPDAAPDVRLVTVCSCGEYGCGHTSCKLTLFQDRVAFSGFDADCSPDGHLKRFEFARTNYDSVVAEIVGLAREKQRAATLKPNN